MNPVTALRMPPAERALNLLAVLDIDAVVASDGTVRVTTAMAAVEASGVLAAIDATGHTLTGGAITGTTTRARVTVVIPVQATEVTK